MLGILTWGLMLPPLIFFAIDKPEDVGLLPDGESRAASTEADAPTAEITGLTLGEALRTISFHIVAAGWFSIAMLVTTPHFWQVQVLTHQGISTEFAARAFTISAVGMVVAMPLVGRLFDKLPTRYVFAIGLLVTAALLTLITFADTGPGAILYSVVFGINNAFSMTMFGFLWPRYFGRKHLGAIQGTGQMIGVFGASVGPFPVSWAFDAVGDATWTLRLLALVPAVIAVVAVIFLKTHQTITESDDLE